MWPCRYGEAPRADQVEEFKRISSHFFAQHPGEIIGECSLISCPHVSLRRRRYTYACLLKRSVATSEMAGNVLCTMYYVLCGQLVSLSVSP